MKINLKLSVLLASVFGLHSLRKTLLPVPGMKKTFRLLLVLLLPLASLAQQTFTVSDAHQRYQDAKQWFREKNYRLAYPVFQDIEKNLTAAEAMEQQLKFDELRFYTIACGLMQNNPLAEQQASHFLTANTAAGLRGQLAFYLGMYYFHQQKYDQALEAYDKASIENLDNEQVADMQFTRGYSYFTQKQLAQAKPLLASVSQLPDSKYYGDANYYYGLIVFNERKYREALKSFEIAQRYAKYQPLVPYYMASINYALGQKDKAIAQAETALKSGNQYYSTELKKLIGHGYFERKDYAQALVYLEQYVNSSDKVAREDLYELGYCYYQQQQLTKAINQFKPLSGGQDSLSQHAMYLLGDAYLKTNQKANARNAFLFCSTNSSYPLAREVSLFQYGKLSYELGFDNEALPALKQFIHTYSRSSYSAEAKDLLVNVLSNTSNYKEALELYESLSGLSENTKKQYPKILYNRAQELINDRQYAAAEHLLDKALRAQYNDAVKPLLLFWKGELAYAKDNFEDAATYYNQYLQNPLHNGDANADNARYNLGYCLLRLEKYSAAKQEFSALMNKRLANEQQEQDVVVRLADAYYMQKDFGQAQPLYNRAINNKAAAADYATFQNGMIAGARNKPAEKITILRSVETGYPASILVPAAHMEIANTYLADEQFRDAIPYLNKIIAGKNSSSLKPEAYLKSGIALFNLDNNSEALAQFKALLKQYPQAPESEDAIDNVRSIFVEQGKPDEFISFMKSIGKNIDNNQADSLTYSAVELQLSDGKKEQALASLKSYIQKYPNGRYMVEANYNAAELSREAKDLASALVYYEAVAAKAPNKYAEKSMLGAARIQYFDNKDYSKAAVYYQQLKSYATSQDNKLEAMRGLVRCQYYGKQYAEAVNNARDLLQQKGIGADDKVFANLVLGKSAEQAGNMTEAISYYKTVAGLNKAEAGAEARYQIAECYYKINKLSDAETAAFEVIKKAGSYGYWVTKAYILLGDIYFKQKDYFNAKATYKSVVDNATDADLKNEANEKLVRAEAEEQAQSKIKG